MATVLQRSLGSFPSPPSSSNNMNLLLQVLFLFFKLHIDDSKVHVQAGGSAEIPSLFRLDPPVKIEYFHRPVYFSLLLIRR